MTPDDKHALAVAATGAGLLLGGLHAALWGHKLLAGKWGRVGGYTLGTGVLLAARCYWALRTGHKAAIGADFVITATGGAVVAACWALRIRPDAWRFVWTVVRGAFRQAADTLGSDATMAQVHSAPATAQTVWLGIAREGTQA